jgi:DNA repair exonuclease SbcCD ATPase subunit
VAGENDLELTVKATTGPAINELEKFETAGAKSIGALRREAIGLATEMQVLEGEIRDSGGATDEQKVKLAQLNQKYDDAIRRAGAYAAAQDDVKKATNAASASIDGQVRPITSAGDAFDRMGGKIGKAGGILTAFVVTFETFYSVTTRLKDKINEFTDGALDRLIQKAIALNPLYKGLGKLLGEDIAGATDEAIKASDKLGTSLEGQAKFAGQAAAKLEEAAGATKSFDDYLKEIAPDQEAVAEGAEEVGEVAPKAYKETADKAQMAAEQTAKLRQETEALAQAQRALENAQKSQADVQQSITELQQRQAELGGKGILTPEEADEQAAISAKLFEAEQRLGEAVKETTMAQIDADLALRQRNEAEEQFLDNTSRKQRSLAEEKKIVEETIKLYEKLGEASDKLHERLGVIKTDLQECLDLARELAQALAGLGE